MSTPHIRHYVALGDSLAEGFFDWGQGDRSLGFANVLAGLLRTTSAQLEFTNLGRAGARTADVLRNQLDRALALNPDLVTLIIGANDVPGTPPNQFRRDYNDLIGRLRTQTRGIVAVANLPDFAHLLPAQYVAYRVALQQRVASFNHIIEESVTAHGALLVDLHTSREVEDPRNLSGDGVHPNARGYRAMARAFAQSLNTAGFELELPALD